MRVRKTENITYVLESLARRGYTQPLPKLSAAHVIMLDMWSAAMRQRQLEKNDRDEEVLRSERKEGREMGK